MRPRGNWIWYSVAGVIFAFLYFSLKLMFPKNAEMIPFFMAIIILDIYLWSSYKKFLVGLNRLPRLIFSFIFWLSPLMLVLMVVILMIRPLLTLGTGFRTYWLGIILIFYAGKFIPIIFLLIADIARGIKYLVFAITGKVKTPKIAFMRNRFITRTGWALGLVLFLLLWTGMFFWVYDFRVREEKIILPELPASFEGMKIVQISDIHLGSWTNRNKFVKAINIVNELNPDYIFVTGDLANFATVDVLPFRKELSELKCKGSIFVIMGNHDYGDYTSWPSNEAKMQDRENLYKLFDDLKWVKLLNDHRIIRRGNDSIAVIGVHNWGRTMRFQRLGDLIKAEKGVSRMQVQLLLSHDPTHWKSIVTNHRNIDVMFAGHTHAMQLGFRLFGKEFSPAAFVYAEWGGMYQQDVGGSHPQYLYVNRGLGTIGYPGRVGELPEITLFTLTSH